MTSRLHRQAPVMRKAGWIVDDDGGANHANAVRWTITPPARDDRTPGSPSSPDSPALVGDSQPSESPSPFVGSPRQAPPLVTTTARAT